MKTRNLKIDSSKYWLITADEAFLVQNTSNSFLQIMASDTQPDLEENGVNLREGEALTQVHLTGKIWAIGDCTLVITDTTGELPQPGETPVPPWPATHTFHMRLIGEDLDFDDLTMEAAGGTLSKTVIDAHTIDIWSDDPVTQIGLEDDGYAYYSEVSEVHILKGDTLISLAELIIGHDVYDTLFTGVGYLCDNCNQPRKIFWYGAMNVENFEDAFRSTEFNCINYIDTTHATSVTDMFRSSHFISPTAAEQTAIEAGMVWTNGTTDCEAI